MPCEEGCRTAVLGKTERTVGWEGNGKLTMIGLVRHCKRGNPQKWIGPIYRGVSHSFTLDCVVLCKANTERVLRGIRAVLGYLELSLNEEKTKVVDARQESFNFLGFTTRLIKNPKTGRRFPLIRPSKEAVKHIKAEIRELTCRKNLLMPEEVVIVKVNEVVRGWTGYFYYENCSKDLSALKHYPEERVRTYLRRKHRTDGRGYKVYPYQYLYGTLGLYKIPTTAPWTQAVKASGRR
jgi:RNA-directed DNA polymerase